MTNLDANVNLFRTLRIGGLVRFNSYEQAAAFMVWVNGRWEVSRDGVNVFDDSEIDDDEITVDEAVATLLAR